MEIIGLDLNKRSSQLAMKADDGTITDRPIATTRERFTTVFGERPRARILLEASTAPAATQNLPVVATPNSPS